MNSADYVVVFDVSGQTFKGWWVLVSASPLSVAGVMMAVISDTRQGKVVGVAVALLAIGWGAAGFALSFSQFERFQGLYRRGEYSVVEGRVENFDRGSPNGTVAQTFYVDGRRFAQRRAVAMPTFNRTYFSGGPDLNNKCVKIAYVDVDDILWLGVRSCE